MQFNLARAAHSVHLSQWERSARDSVPGEGFCSIESATPPHPSPLPNGERERVVLLAQHRRAPEPAAYALPNRNRSPFCGDERCGEKKIAGGDYRNDSEFIFLLDEPAISTGRHRGAAMQRRPARQMAEKRTS